VRGAALNRRRPEPETEVALPATTTTTTNHIFNNTPAAWHSRITSEHAAYLIIHTHTFDLKFGWGHGPFCSAQLSDFQFPPSHAIISHIIQPTISLCRRHISQRSNYCLMRNRGPIVRIAGERHRVTSIDSKCDINLEKYNPTITIVLYCTGLDFPGPGPNFLK